jgi:SP family arabinose:H+ symporter-like MFS transporter
MENVPEPEGLTMETMRKYFRQIIIALFLSVMQNFCGHPNLLNFAPEIFAQIGFDSEEGRLISTTFLGVVKFITVCYTIKRVEVYGRRYLLLVGMSIIAVSLFVLSLAYLVNGGGEMSVLGKVFATLSVFGVAGGYSLSFGPLVWLIVSELFPSTIRGRALGGSTICGYAAASLVSYTFLTGQDVGLFVPFAIYCFLTLLSIGFTYIYIPDTAGKSPDEIHQELISGWGSERLHHRPILVNVVQAESDREIV